MLSSRISKHYNNWRYIVISQLTVDRLAVNDVLNTTAPGEFKLSFNLIIHAWADYSTLGFLSAASPTYSKCRVIARAFMAVTSTAHVCVLAASHCYGKWKVKMVFQIQAQLNTTRRPKDQHGCYCVGCYVMYKRPVFMQAYYSNAVTLLIQAKTYKRVWL